MIHRELGVSVAGDGQPGDIPQSSTNDVDGDDNKEENEHLQQDKAECDVLLQDLITVTAGNNLLHACIG